MDPDEIDDRFIDVCMTVQFLIPILNHDEDDTFARRHNLELKLLENGAHMAIYRTTTHYIVHAVMRKTRYIEMMNRYPYLEDEFEISTTNTADLFHLDHPPRHLGDFI